MLFCPQYNYLLHDFIISCDLKYILFSTKSSCWDHLFFHVTQLGTSALKSNGNFLPRHVIELEN